VAHQVAFNIVLGVWIVGEWRIRLRSHFNRRGSRRDRGSLLVVFAFIAAGLVGGFALAANLHGPGMGAARWPLFVVGLVLASAGIALRQWSVALLGRFFTIDVRVHPDQTVVDRGPYRWVRHPSYTGMILTLVGIGLALGNWASVAVLAVVPTVGLAVHLHF
jgi:protein-S-isoprenylcysteine O-methyltransferase Ste14